ncbi:MAG: glutaredoxin [Clostridia bacterium]|nr:glutaredoxin [Clostridia bacterium]
MKHIEVWTFKFCPYCVKVKKLFEDLKIPYTEHMIPFGDPRLKDLEAKTGCGTLPQIFADGEFIGDCDLMHVLHEKGELMEVIKS